MRHRRLTALFVLMAFLASPMAWAHVSAAGHAVAGMDATAHHGHDLPAGEEGDGNGDSNASHATCCHLHVCSGSALHLPSGMHSPPPRAAADTGPPGEDPLAIAGLRHPPPLRPPRA